MALTVRRFEVEVFSQTMLLHGVIESFRRLSDLANEAEPYLQMSEIQWYPYRGDTILGSERLQHGLVSKDMIVLLAEPDTAAQEPPQGGDVSVVKVPHPVLVYTNHFTIDAEIHLAEGAVLEQFLAASPGKFMAVTNAKATPTEPGTQLTSFSRHFLLINRAHIAFFGTEEPDKSGTPPVGAQLIG
jgi:hypothetical protein